MICQNLKISNIKQNNKGISVRKNNHPISTLREIKKNYL